LGEVDGVIVQPLRVIADARGAVMHMLRADAPHFEQFGEVYFSVVLRGAVKAWKRHRRMAQNLAVPVGAIRLVVHDDRAGSPSKGTTQEILAGEDHYVLVTIPPLVWYGFQGLAEPRSLIANCATLAHDPAESEAVDPAASPIPFRW
jgi:dTDP-4-dehydrorhamnose 3,5-epimerase